MADPGEIGAREAFGWLHGEGPGPFYLLDVRNEEEFARWRMEGALRPPVVNVPYFAFVDDPDAALARVPRELGTAAVVCAKGDSSAFVRDVLRDAGLPAVNVAGGMAAWGDLHVPLLVHDRGGVEVWQVSRYGKGCLSYVVVSGGEAAVIDPSRFVDRYRALAAERGARIVEVLDTHVHADHLSGGPALARAVGATYRVAGGDGAEHAAAAPLKDGDRLRAGDATLEVLRTPGHTPGSACFLVSGSLLVSGDTVFVRGVGRPDLGGKLEEWGRALHFSLRRIAAAVTQEATVLPAHFSGAGESDDRGAVHCRLGDVSALGPALALAHAAQFVELLREGMREPPATYADIARANLGLLDAGARAEEWELGRNECAAARARR